MNLHSLEGTSPYQVTSSTVCYNMSTIFNACTSMKFVGVAGTSGKANSMTNRASISLPNSIFSELINKRQSEASLVFTAYQTSNLFPLKPNEARHPRFQIASSVIGASVAGQSITALSQNITVTMDFNPVCIYTVKADGLF